MGSSWSFLSIPQWYSYGGKHFGKAGFRAAQARWEAKAMAATSTKRKAASGAGSGGDDALGCSWAKGKTVLVTGANSGLGYETALSLAQREANVIMICRNSKRAEAAAAAIEKETGRKPAIEICDMSSMKSIREFSQRWAAWPEAAPEASAESGEPEPAAAGGGPRGRRVDAIVNNAGLMLKDYTATDEGLETVFATMAGGTYYLTLLMLPHLQAVRDGSVGRVINVTSAGGYMVRAKASLLNMPPSSYSDLFAYSHSKRAQIEINDLMAEKVAAGSRSLGPGSKGKVVPRPISFVSMHPGWSATPGLARSMPSFSESSDLRSAAEGADTIVWMLDIDDKHAARLNGELVFDREATFKHFTMAGTQLSESERDAVWSTLGKIYDVDADELIATCVEGVTKESGGH